MQVKKNNSEKNQENKPRSLIKKLSFLWVLLGAVLIHFWINHLGLKDGDRYGYIIILWLAATAISFNMILYSFSKGYKDGWNDFNNGEFDIDAITGKKTDKRIYIENNGVLTEAVVEKISNRVFRSIVIRVIYCMITYSFFDKKGNKVIKIKKYNDQGLQNIPKIGDKIKIIYDESNPSDSVIFHEEINPKVKWYQQKQKKFTITIINNTK